MLRYAFLIILCFPLTLVAQKLLGKTKTEVKRELEKISKKKGSTAILTVTDTTLLLSTKDKEAQGDLVFIYSFDSAGKCTAEKFTTGCKSCYAKQLQSLLDQQAFGWKKINENQYASKFEAKLLLELPPEDNQYYFVVFPMNWSKEMYDLLLKN